MREKIKIPLLTVLFAIIIPLYPVDNTKLQMKYQKFLQVETKEAREMISSFSYEELLSIMQKQKRIQSRKVNRTYWLIEAYFIRHADRVANDKLFYLFLSVISLFSLLIGFVIATYVRQNKALKMLGKEI